MYKCNNNNNNNNNNMGNYDIQRSPIMKQHMYNAKMKASLQNTYGCLVSRRYHHQMFERVTNLAFHPTWPENNSARIL
jgi:hypothetical protein